MTTEPNRYTVTLTSKHTITVDAASEPEAIEKGWVIAHSLGEEYEPVSVTATKDEPLVDPLLDLLAEYHLGEYRSNRANEIRILHLPDTHALLYELNRLGLVSPGVYDMRVEDVIHQVNNVNGLEVFITTNPAELDRWQNERPWESDTPWDVEY